ncbi:MAG: hypothetical protein VB102_09005 [Paludibacter sp.]|nr:hypothetical protein [Paludibacter sp.]
MKKQGLKATIVFLLITVQLIPLMSQTATKLSVLDTRDVNTGPNGFDFETKIEFKNRSVIGVPGTGMYSGLLTIAPWSDNSGNKHHQLNFNDGGIFYRTGWPLDTTWGAWTKLVLEDANGKVGIGGSLGVGTQTPNSKIEVKSVHLGNQDDEIRIGSYYNNNFYGLGLNYRINSVGDPSKHIIEYHRGIRYDLMAFANGKIGIGTTNPLANLHINSGANNNYATILATSNEGNNLVVSSHDTQPHSCTVFKISHEYSNNPSHRNNGYIAFHRGSSENGGFLELGTSGLQRLLIDPAGRVGIGTTSPDQMLTVNGKIHAKEVIVDLNVLADYVFEPDYNLMPLHKVEQFVQANKHLPGIPSASEVKNDGLSMGEMQNKLLQKIEELTLYVIDQGKTIHQQNARIKELEEKLK